MTALNCRAHTTRMRVAYMVDAYRAKCGKPFDPSVSPDNTITRIGSMFTDGGHPYMKMWGVIERLHGCLNWNELCDPELDDLWKRAKSPAGLDIHNIHIDITDIAAAQKRWNDALWTRYEFKRNNRHMLGGMLGKLAVLV